MSKNIETSTAHETVMDEQNIASQEAFDKFAGVNGNKTPIDQEYIYTDMNKLGGPLTAETHLSGPSALVSLAHFAENRLNSNKMRNSKDFQDRQRREKDAGHLLPH